MTEDTAIFTTVSDKKVNLLNLKKHDIDISDIAHHLSLICRYNGAIKNHYSVAQHSILVSFLVPQQYALEGLLHDGEEAYTGDMVRPLKKLKYMWQFVKIASNIQSVIQSKFLLSDSEECRNAVEKADNIALLTEQRDLRGKKDFSDAHDGNAPHPYIRLVFGNYADCMSVKEEFLKRFQSLWKERYGEVYNLS